MKIFSLFSCVPSTCMCFPKLQCTELSGPQCFFFSTQLSHKTGASSCSNNVEMHNWKLHLAFNTWTKFHVVCQHNGMSSAPKLWVWQFYTVVSVTNSKGSFTAEWTCVYSISKLSTIYKNMLSRTHTGTIRHILRLAQKASSFLFVIVCALIPFVQIWFFFSLVVWVLEAQREAETASENWFLGSLILKFLACSVRGCGSSCCDAFTQLQSIRTRE